MKIIKLGIMILGFFLFAFTFATDRVCTAENTDFHRFVYPEYSKKISMDFKDADLKNVLKIFSQQSGMNFISASDIADMKVSLFFENVPVEEALDRILSANNLIYELEPGSDIFVVKKIVGPAINVITRIYALQHATVPGSQLLTTLDKEGDIDSATTSSSTSNSGSSSTTLEEINEGIAGAVQNVLTEFGKVAEDPRTNSLIVTDVPSQFPIIEKTIARLDVPIPQILIDVEMLDISKNTATQLGVKYGTTLSFQGAQRNVLYPWDQNKILEAGKYAFSPEYVAGTIDASGLTMVLQFLRTQTDTKYLANPKILTLNNQSAQIKISTDEAIGVVTSTGGSEGITTQNVEAERAQTGVFLTVTPQVNLQTGEITMAVVPKVIEARTGATYTTSNGTITFKDPEKRMSKTILRVKNAETIYLGGLKKNTETTTVTKIPVLGDVPLLGGLFRHKDTSNVERELVIFITPKIVSDHTADRLAAASADLATREQSYPITKKRAIEKDLLATEQRLQK